MSLSKILSVVALGSFACFSVAACAANTDLPEDEQNVADSQDDLSSSKIHACETDADCVAVPRGGCCSNGWLEAVNLHHERAYANASKCKEDPAPMCPMYIVDDTRVPQCNTNAKGKRQCEMVAVEDIACGGHTMHPHACPDGYTCDVSGKPVDAPGVCKKAPEPTDCRASGCADGRYCSYCWGKFACIPNGAVC
jgi:hypothetical protein